MYMKKYKQLKILWNWLYTPHSKILKNQLNKIEIFCINQNTKQNKIKISIYSWPLPFTRKYYRSKPSASWSYSVVDTRTINVFNLWYSRDCSTHNYQLQIICRNNNSVSLAEAFGPDLISIVNSIVFLKYCELYDKI